MVFSTFLCVVTRVARTNTEKSQVPNSMLQTNPNYPNPKDKSPELGPSSGYRDCVARPTRPLFEAFRFLRLFKIWRLELGICYLCRRVDEGSPGMPPHREISCISSGRGRRRQPDDALLPRGELGTLQKMDGFGLCPHGKLTVVQALIPPTGWADVVGALAGRVVLTLTVAFGTGFS